MTWWIHATNNKESKSRVIFKTRQKPYLERKLSNDLSSLLSRCVELATFSFKLPLFYSKLAFFLLKLSSATFSLFQNCQVCYFFIENYKVSHFHIKLFSCHFFNWHCQARYFYLFSIVMGSLLFHSKPSTLSLIRSTLLLFYWKRSSSLLLFEIVEFATFFSLKVVKNIQFATFLSKTD